MFEKVILTLLHTFEFEFLIHRIFKKCIHLMIKEKIL